ncbi:MAG: hypothetical protein V4568_02565 [Pseudomonadota bacterium]
MGYRLNAGRPGWKAKTTSYRAVNVRRWQRGGFLNAGHSFGWAWWSDSGEKVASINVAVGSGDSQCLTISYSWRNYGNDEWQYVNRIVSLARTPGTYGGSLTWFACPYCYRRAVHLYIAGNHVACRRCLKLTYPSQCEDELGRAHRRVGKIEAKLFRKGMHQKTIERLANEYESAEDELDALFCARAIHLFGTSVL